MYIGCMPNTDLVSYRRSGVNGHSSSTAAFSVVGKALEEEFGVRVWTPGSAVSSDEYLSGWTDAKSVRERIGIEGRARMALTIRGK